MSIAKITEVKAARKDQGQCDRCDAPLPAGSPYRWFQVGFRSNFKRVRCMKPVCTPKLSERESSKIATIYAAQEDFDVADCTTIDEINQAVRDFADGVREVADEYTEASTDDTGNVFNTDAEERADTLNSSADELDSWEHEGEFEPCEAHANNPDTPAVGDEGPTYDCSDCADAWVAFLDDARAAAQEAVDTIDTP